MAEAKEKSVTVRIPENLHKPARVRIAELDSSFQSVLIDLLRDWIKGEAPARSEPKLPSRTLAGYAEGNRQWHDILELVLNDPNERIGIEKNLEWAGAALKLSSSAPKRKRSGG